MTPEIVEGVNTVVAGGLPRLLEWDMLFRIVLQLFLFAASAFFSGSETALFAMTRFDLQRLSRSRHPAADKLHRLLEQPRRLIVSILCGNELVNIAAAANMTGILVELVGLEAAAWTATFVMIPLILLLGEVTPKTVAVSNPVWASTRIVAAPMSIWVRVVTPLAMLVRVLADRTTTLLVGPERAEENILRVEELRTLVEQGVQSGEIAPTERALINSLIRAGATEVGQIMTPRTQLSFVDGGLAFAQLRAQFLALRRARVPVYEGVPDNVIGFLYVEDVVAWQPEDAGEFDLRRHLHPALAVPATRQVEDMLDFFDEHQVRAALVVDEQGGTDGIVTLTDVTRYLFSGVFDQAADEVPITPVQGAYEVDGDTPLADVRRVTGLELRDPAMRTLAGMALNAFGKVPAVGERVVIEGITFEVLEMDGFRIHRLRLTRDGGRSLQEESPA